VPRLAGGILRIAAAAATMLSVAVAKAASGRCRLLLTLMAATTFDCRPLLAEDTVETESEFTIRINPNFPVPTAADRERFLTAQAHMEGFVQFNRVWPDAADIWPYNSLFAASEARANINLGPHFSINGLLRFDRGQEQTTDTVFADQVLFVQRLFGVVHLPPFDFYVGKIHPRFGVGWYATPGLYGGDYDTDYELLEKIGGGMRWDIRAFGRHRVTAEVFHTDTSFLANSLIPGTVRRGLLSLQDGGAGNTGTLESFAFALSGQRMPDLDGLSYQVGWSRQKASPFDVRDESSWSIAAMWRYNIVDNLSVEPMGEFVSVTGQGGFDRDVDYLTLAATLRKGAWALAAHTTQRYVRDHSADSFRTDSLIGLAVAYELKDLNCKLPWLDGLTAIVGVRQSTTFGITGQTVGAQVKYTLDF
jgi:hypothetical protein